MERLNNRESRRIIFYHPVPLQNNPKSASGLRPIHMLNALKASGYNVDLVVGHSQDRKRSIRLVRKNVRHGVRYSFVYGESSTMPSELTDPCHLPLRPFLDYRFLRFCRHHDIPVGLFYRDIYWRFKEYKARVPLFKRMVAILFYRIDIVQYRHFLTKLFIPSIEMEAKIPGKFPKGFCMPLPPAHDDPNLLEVSDVETLNMLYVGGIGNHYRLHKLVDVIRDEPEIHLTICVRKKEWMVVCNDFGTTGLPANISVTHASGSDLERIYRRSRLAVLYVEPSRYREFAVPYKLFEYLGWGLPIIASRGTLSGKLVEELDIGWSIEYSQKALRALIRQLQAEPKRVEAKKASIMAIRRDHTWSARVRDVEKALIRGDMS